MDREAEGRSEKIKKHERFGVIKGPFKTMDDVWQRLIAFERRWEEEAELEDSGPLKAVREEMQRAVRTLRAEQDSLTREVNSFRAHSSDKQSLVNVTEHLRKHEKLHESAFLPCLLCGSTEFAIE